MTTPLPPPGSPEPDEPLPGEAELAALYRQLPQNEPGPALDAAVLHAAAQALGADATHRAPGVERRKAPREPGDWVRPKPDSRTARSSTHSTAAGRNTRPRWLIAFSSAATVVLAAGLAWHMRGVSVGETAGAPASTTSAAPARARAVNTAAPADVAMDMAAPAPSARPEPAQQAAPKLVTSTPAATANSLRKAAADRPMERASSAGRLSDRSSLSAPAAPAPEAPASGNPAARTAPPALAEAAPPVSAQMAPAPPPAAVAAAPLEADVAEITTPNATDTPTQELDKIRRLFAQGHDDEARQRLLAFRHAHPQWPLPPELRARLRKP